VVNPTVIAVPPRPVAPTLVEMQVVTDPPGARVQAEPVSGEGARFTCTTPCTERVPAHGPLRLTAQRGARRGTLVVEPSEAMAPVHVTLDPVSVRRATPTPTPAGGRPAPRRCGVMDPETQLLIPCFPGGSH